VRRVNAIKDAAENSQALRDSLRATTEFEAAEVAGATPAVLAELARVLASADARVDSLRHRVA
jgi:hypothetical protein